MRAIGCTVIVRVPICASRVLSEVVSTKGTYGMLVPMNKNKKYLEHWDLMIRALGSWYMLLWSNHSITKNLIIPHTDQLHIVSDLDHDTAIGNI